MRQNKSRYGSALLVLMVSLFSSFPFVKAIPPPEILWVNSLDDTYLEWIESGISPYLQDTDVDYFRVKTEGYIEGNFGFAVSSSSDIIESSILWIECEADGDDFFDVYVSDGGSFTNEGIITPDASYSYKTLDLSTKLDTWTKINVSEIYVVYHAGGSKNNFVIVRRAYLNITVSASGTDYSRDVSQGISWAGVGYRSWSASRDFTQGISLSSDSGRTWTLTRAFTQSLTFSFSAFEDLMEYILIQVSQSIAFTSDSLRVWSLSRTFSQGISFASTTERIVQFMRNPLQGITASAEAFRTWSLTRTLTQSLTFSSNALADIFKAFQRTLTMSIQLSSNTLRKWILSRLFTQGLSFSSLTSRNWTLLRIATQSLTANIESHRIVSAIRQLSQNIAISSNAGRIGTFLRGLSQSITLSSETFRSWSLSRSFTQGISLASSIWTHLTVGAEQFLRTLTLSMSLSTESTRTWSLSRSFTQGLSIISSIFVKLTEYIPDPPDPKEFFRAVSISLELVSSNIRQWSLTRIFSQGISFSNSIWTKLYVDVIRRVATMALNLDMQLSFVATIIMKNNMEVIGLIGLSLILQIAYMYLIYKEYNPLYRAILGIVTMACWFATGHVSLSLNPNEGMAISAIYDIIGTIDALFAVKAALDFMQLSQKADDFWEIS